MNTHQSLPHHGFGSVSPTRVRCAAIATSAQASGIDELVQRLAEGPTNWAVDCDSVASRHRPGAHVTVVPRAGIRRTERSERLSEDHKEAVRVLDEHLSHAMRPVAGTLDVVHG